VDLKADQAIGGAKVATHRQLVDNVNDPAA
jgi:hypothetical protein